MRVAFVNDACERLGVEYLSAVLKGAGHEVRLFVDPQLFDDENVSNEFLAKVFDGKKKLIAELQAYKPDLVGISVVTDFYQWALGMTRLIKAAMDVPIILGGVHPTSVPERVIAEPTVDMVCVGEGEHALLELVDSMARGAVDHGIRNIWFKKEGQVIRNEVRPLVEDLDALPQPDKDLYYSVSPHFSQCYYIMTSRGCAHACSYCCHSFLKGVYDGKGRYLRQRSVDHVIAELEAAVQRPSRKMVRFHDDDLLAHSVAWLEDFAAAYKERVGLPFACFIHPNTVTDEKVALLKKAGCHDVEMGVQSIGEDTRRQALSRDVSQAQLLKAFEVLKRHGMNVITDNILGIPGQDVGEVVDLLKFYNENRVMKIYCFGFRYYPRTRVVAAERASGRLSAEDVARIEAGVGAKAFIQGGDHWDKATRQVQTFFTFLLYLPKGFNRFIIHRKLYRFFPPLPYFISVIFSNWFRIPFKYNWALHITIARYRHFLFSGRRKEARP
jgi:tRNA A37 methylthiotransferase MiaB